MSAFLWQQRSCLCWRLAGRWQSHAAVEQTAGRKGKSLLWDTACMPDSMRACSHYSHTQWMAPLGSHTPSCSMVHGGMAAPQQCWPGAQAAKPLWMGNVAETADILRTITSITVYFHFLLFSQSFLVIMILRHVQFKFMKHYTSSCLSCILP